MISANLPFILYLALFAAMFIGIAVPLRNERIAMNRWYGVRFKESFISDELWYDLNRYGARQLIWGGVVLLIDAVAMLFVPVGAGGIPLVVLLFFPVGMALVGALFTYQYGRKRARELEESS